MLPGFVPYAVTEATFPKPKPGRTVDSAGVRLPSDADQLHVRSGASPFRCLGRMGAFPRRYQLAPLLMVLSFDPAGQLITDDVGIGKTIEARQITHETSRSNILRGPETRDQRETRLYL